MKSHENPFTPILKGKILIFGIGNILRGDDGLGPMLIENLKGKVRALCLDGGSAPENFLGKIINERPDTILIIDALHMGERPGEFKIIKPGELQGTGFTTHTIPLRILIEYLKSELESNIFILGVQPSSVQMGLPLSDAVEHTIRSLESLICHALSSCAES
ncbi:MAG: hypothetical protein AMS17_12125 [Spirochaetes bacterium DG_61]|jgi:hydrogenase 3 maturation protease|nr:MAG: hypothetical protein AMS17_12125 [Spirochaetes bacterium DG_61]